MVNNKFAKLLPKLLTLSLIITGLLFYQTDTVFSAIQEIHAEGEYRLGDRDNRETAKKAALADAKRRAVEQAGVFIESKTAVDNFQVTKDQIKTVTAAVIKIKYEQVDFYDNGTMCKAFIIAEIDVDKVEDILRKNMVKNSQRGNNSEADEYKRFRLINAGYDEFNGHYYKLYNEGIIWVEALKCCRELGGHLVTITSRNEQQFIVDMVRRYGSKNLYCTNLQLKVDNESYSW